MEELRERMSPAEFLRWEDYDSQKPHSEAWEQAALLASIFANVFASKGRQSKPSDFLPPRLKFVEAPSPEVFKSKFRSFATRHNAAVLARAGHAPSGLPCPPSNP